MKVFDRVEGVAAALPLDNVDTDKILGAQFLKTISRAGLGAALFHALRSDPSFVLNRTPWTAASILVAGDNFGCGSSREHAVWALDDFGIRCVIAPTIADIFYNNCCKNGVLPIALPQTDINVLLAAASDPSTARLRIDLREQAIALSDGRQITFKIDERHRQRLLSGADEIDTSLAYRSSIEAFEARQAENAPWLRRPITVPAD